MTTINQQRIEAQLLLVGDIMRTNDQAILNHVVQVVQKLASAAKSLHRRYEASCSYPWANTDAYEAKTERMEENAVSLAAELGLTLWLQRDPRGWPFIINIGMFQHRLG